MFSVPEIDENSIPAGFRWGAASAAIRKPGRLDVGLIAADKKCAAAGAFTTNKFCAAPVTLCRELLATSQGHALGIVANSGCANAATGESGMADARTMSADAARDTGNSDAPFLVCSTGVIGAAMPMDRMSKGIADASKALAATPQAFRAFAKSIITTDTHEKMAAGKLEINGRQVRILACAKGAGMIAPNMATLLAFVTTDIAIAPSVLKDVFARVVNRSLNCMTVDGDMSTNDTALILASGASGACAEAGAELEAFEAALLEVMQSLAKQLARDGEGATKLIEIEVSRADSFESARRAALAIANSNLVKTAIYGRDANWGRIACAVGYSGAPFELRSTTIRLGPLELFREGEPLPLDEAAAVKVLEQEFVRIDVQLGTGNASATVWTCDLTEDYIRINASYRT